jgi:membrane protease YdiL (CAAX protease family)
MALKPVETKPFLLSVGALVVAEGFAAMMVTASGFPMVALGAVRVVETALVFFIVSLWGRGPSSLGLARHQVFAGLKTGLIWSGLFGLAVSLVGILLYASHIAFIPFIKTALPRSTQGLVWFFVVGGLIAPVAEEVFFRGIVYGFLRRWGVVVALAGTTMFFVAAHAIGSGVPITQIVGGIVFALAYEIGGSLMVPITIHILGNLTLFVLSLVLP